MLILKQLITLPFSLGVNRGIIHYEGKCKRYVGISAYQYLKYNKKGEKLRAQRFFAFIIIHLLFFTPEMAGKRRADPERQKHKQKIKCTPKIESIILVTSEYLRNEISHRVSLCYWCCYFIIEFNYLNKILLSMIPSLNYLVKLLFFPIDK